MRRCVEASGATSCLAMRRAARRHVVSEWRVYPLPEELAGREEEREERECGASAGLARRLSQARTEEEDGAEEAWKIEKNTKETRVVEKHSESAGVRHGASRPAERVEDANERHERTKRQKKKKKNRNDLPLSTRRSWEKHEAGMKGELPLCEAQEETRRLQSKST